jgi:hypothetical protein
MRLLAFLPILAVRAIGWVLLLPVRILFPALNVRYEGRAFFGTLDNEPSADIGFVIGATVRVHESDISDWKLIDNGRLVGGYTIRYIRSRMTKRQREYVDANLPYTIDPPTEAQSAA